MELKRESNLKGKFPVSAFSAIQEGVGFHKTDNSKKIKKTKGNDEPVIHCQKINEM